MSLNQRLAEYFARHPGEWIDGKVLAQIAGGYGWRSRVSDLRRQPYGLTIENRMRRVRVLDEGGTVAIDESHGFTVSEYRLVQQQESAA